MIKFLTKSLSLATPCEPNYSDGFYLYCKSLVIDNKGDVFFTIWQEDGVINDISYDWCIGYKAGKT